MTCDNLNKQDTKIKYYLILRTYNLNGNLT